MAHNLEDVRRRAKESKECAKVESMTSEHCQSVLTPHSTLSGLSRHTIDVYCLGSSHL